MKMCLSLCFHVNFNMKAQKHACFHVKLPISASSEAIEGQLLSCAPGYVVAFPVPSV